MKGRLLATIIIVLFAAGIVTLNLNSAAWAKDDNEINSKDSFSISENTNRDTGTNSPVSRNTQNSNSYNCESKDECQKILDNNAMDMLNNLLKATRP